MGRLLRHRIIPQVDFPLDVRVFPVLLLPMLKHDVIGRHEKLVLKKINTHALLYTWVGSDPSLRPVVYMAHSDTVCPSSREHFNHTANGNSHARFQ